jgi:hypothetical protein
LLSSVLIIAVKSLLDSCSGMEMLMSDGGCLIGVCGDMGCCWSEECRWRFIGVGLLIKDWWEEESSRLLMASSLCRALSLLVSDGCCCGDRCDVGFCWGGCGTTICDGGLVTFIWCV